MRNRVPPLRRVILLGLAAICLGGCTRFADHASLSERSPGEWTLSWSSVARRGFNFVDSSGHVGSAHASFACRPHPSRPLTWIVDGPASAWGAERAARKVLGAPAARGWRGTVSVEPNGPGHVLVIELRDIDTGRPFPGNRRFANARGNGTMWIAD